MNLFEGLRIGLVEIRSHKLRAFLTLSGIAVGITSVMAMTGILSGVQTGMRDSVKRLGLGRLIITAQPTNDHSDRSPGLLYEDALAIRRYFPDLRVVSPTVSTWRTPLFYRDFSANVEVDGVTPDWAKIEWLYKLHGRFINDTDLREYAPVCVLIKYYHAKRSRFDVDEDPMQGLLKRYDPLRETVRLGGTSFRVVGILEELPHKENMHIGNEDTAVLLPITSFQKRLSLESRQLDEINLDTGDQASSYALAKRLFAFLKRRHRDVEDFRIMNISDYMGPFLSWLNTATLIIGAVAAIALFAGGVGIMNISLASVNARIKEIGVRKSVGARERDIRLQFLAEAAMLGLLGGVLGVILGGGVCLLVKSATTMTVIISARVVGIALLVSVAVGVLFSWYPARRAARLDPIEALRYE